LIADVVYLCFHGSFTYSMGGRTGLRPGEKGVILE
jgi:hypothetical protein